MPSVYIRDQAIFGIEFLEAVRGGYPDRPFILFTGKGSEELPVIRFQPAFRGTDGKK